MKIDWMLLILSCAMVVLAISFWRAHKNHAVMFNALDLIMDNGKVSRTAFAFMVVLGVSIWVLVDLEIKGKMTEMYYGSFIAAWVTPVVAKIFAGANTDTNTTLTLKETTLETTEKAK